MLVGVILAVIGVGWLVVGPMPDIDEAVAADYSPWPGAAALGVAIACIAIGVRLLMRSHR